MKSNFLNKITDILLVVLIVVAILAIVSINIAMLKTPKDITTNKKTYLISESTCEEYKYLSEVCDE